MAMSTEKDPTCVVEMLNCLRPMDERRTLTHSRRGAAVATRLRFENASLTASSNSITDSFKIASHYTNSQFTENRHSANKRARLSTQQPSVTESPWEYQLMKANLLKARSEIEAKENLIQQLHSVRREQEQVFENEKAALRLRFEESQNMVQSLESRAETLARRSRDSKDELAEMRSQLISTKQTYSDNMRRLEKQASDLREQLAEDKMGAHSSSVNDQRRMTKLEIELKAALEEADEHQKRAAELDVKLKEARQSSQQAELVAQQLLEAQIRIRALESAEQDGLEAMAMVKQQQQKLLKHPEMEREVERLREDNARLRGLVQNKMLLEEKVASLQPVMYSEIQKKAVGVPCARCLAQGHYDRFLLNLTVHITRTRLSGSEQRDRELAQMTATHAGVQRALEEWLSLARDLCAETGQAGVRQHFERLQQRELQLTADAGELKSRLKAALESKAAVAQELADVNAQAERLRQTNEMQTKYAHRVNKKLQLVTVERNSYRSQLDSYERDLTMTTTTALMGSQQEQQRLRIEMLEKALEGYRDLTAKLEADLDKDKKDPTARGSAEQLEKISALEAERDTMRRALDDARRRLQELELELQYRALKGDFNPTKTKVVHMRMNPRSEAESEREDELALLRSECARLRERIRVMQEEQTGIVDLTLVTDERLKASHSAEIQDLRSQVKSLELKLQRLKEAFKVTSNEFREIVYAVLGYRIDRSDNHEYRLSSMYAESPDDVLTFKYKVATGDVELMETAYSNTLGSLIDLHLRRQHSIPVFCSAVTLDLFSQQTFTGGTNTPECLSTVSDMTRP